MKHIELRYAQSDADVVAIHQFLCVVAGPDLPGPIDPKASITEVWRVVNDDVALMAMTGDKLVGTMGIINPDFWWNPKIKFLANRWFHVIDGSGAGDPLLKEACAIAEASDLELHIFDENRRRLRIFNNKRHRHVLRQH